MAFFKFSMVMAVLASACAAPAPQFYATHAPPPPPAVAVVRPVAPPPPPPTVYHAGPGYQPGYHAAPGYQPGYHAVQGYHAAPAPHVPIVSQSYDSQVDGSYVFQYEGADGSVRQEQGISRSPPGSEGPGGVAVQGRYAYASELGPIQVEYIADENGFQPSGNNIHPEIVKAVAAQVAFARSEPPSAYHAPPPPAIYAKSAFAAPPPPPPVAFASTPVPFAAGGYPYKA